MTLPNATTTPLAVAMAVAVAVWRRCDKELGYEDNGNVFVSCIAYLIFQLR